MVIIGKCPMQPEEFAQLLRTELPRLLREHPEV